MNIHSFLLFVLLVLAFGCAPKTSQPKKAKAVFIIVDGIPADVLEKLDLPALEEIKQAGGYTRAYTGGMLNSVSQTPTVSAPGYASLVTGTWANKHRVYDNDIDSINYDYWNIFRIAKAADSTLTLGIFSTWLDNRTKLIGERLPQAGGIRFDFVCDGLEYDTVRFPHGNSRLFIQQIDDSVARAAAEAITQFGPDLSWVYLEYTDDVGHETGTGEQFNEAVRQADRQVGKIWAAIQAREKKFDEDWLLVVTTDHGRDSITGRDHGGQTNRERTIWITTNSKNLNPGFYQTPAMVDILPSICNHLGIRPPASVQNNLDGVSFIDGMEKNKQQAQP